MEIRITRSTDMVERVAHRLPCTVHSDGPAPTARAFCQFPDPITHFRGHALRHGDIQIPEGTTSTLTTSRDLTHIVSNNIY